MTVTHVTELDELVAKVKKAQREFANFSQEQVDKIFRAAALTAADARIPLANLGLSATGDRTVTKIEKLLAWLEKLKSELGIPTSIREAGVQEADFLAKIDKLSEDAFDDQCTGANPRYPLISELKQLLLDSYYGREFTETIAAEESR